MLYFAYAFRRYEPSPRYLCTGVSQRQKDLRLVAFAGETTYRSHMGNAAFFADAEGYGRDSFPRLIVCLGLSQAA